MAGVSPLRCLTPGDVRLGLAGRDAERVVRRAEQEADPLVALASRELDRGADAVHWDEAQLAHGRRVARTRDEDAAEPAERRLARVPVAERQERVDGAAGAVVLDRAAIGGSRTLGVGEQLRIAPGPGRVEEHAVRLLRRMREVPCESVDED